MGVYFSRIYPYHQRSVFCTLLYSSLPVKTTLNAEILEELERDHYQASRIEHALGLVVVRNRLGQPAFFAFLPVQTLLRLLERGQHESRK